MRNITLRVGRFVFGFVVLTVQPLLVMSLSAADGAKPNILLILADDK